MPAPDASVGTILLLGAVHGVNPAMGWLFAVSLGLQEQRRGAVWAALAPLALGHTLSIAAVVLAATALGAIVPAAILKWITAAALLGFGIDHLRRHRHPRRCGMRVGTLDLVIWSFLVATAHGAGLMVLPFLPDAAAVGHAAHAHHLAAGLSAAGLSAAGLSAAGLSAAGLSAAGLSAAGYAGLIASFVHSAGYLLAAGITAVVVYEKLGLRLLRTAWINLNVIWAVALIITAVATLLM